MHLVDPAQLRASVSTTTPSITTSPASPPLHVLTGEYDWSSTPTMGQALAAAVPGATCRVMPGLGHFPMCENPASVCTGAMVLATAGLLDGLSSTTHYGAYDLLGEVAPRTTVMRGVRYVDNGKVITSAGVQAGMDMALHVVARLLGDEAARETARYIEYEWRPEDVRGAGG